MDFLSWTTRRSCFQKQLRSWTDHSPVFILARLRLCFLLLAFAASQVALGTSALVCLASSWGFATSAAPSYPLVVATIKFQDLMCSSFIVVAAILQVLRHSGPKENSSLIGPFAGSSSGRKHLALLAVVAAGTFSTFRSAIVYRQIELPSSFAFGQHWRQLALETLLLVV